MPGTVGRMGNYPVPTSTGRMGNYPVPSTTYAVRDTPPYMDPRVLQGLADAASRGVAGAASAVRGIPSAIDPRVVESIQDAASAAANEAEYIGNKLYDSGNEVLRNLPGVGAGFRTNEANDVGRRAGALLMEYIDKVTGGNLPYRDSDPFSASVRGFNPSIGGSVYGSGPVR